MKQFFTRLNFSVGFFSLLFLTTACNSSSDHFPIMDSVAYAREILARHGDKGSRGIEFGIRPGDPSKSIQEMKKFKGISFERIERWAASYDHDPLFTNMDGEPYHGFMIDSNGLNCIRRNPNYINLYLRFGKYSDDPLNDSDYTIMIVPLKGDSTILMRTVGVSSDIPGQNSNYDALDPCPSVCPKDWVK